MAASFLSSSALTGQSQATATRRLVVASAARGNGVGKDGSNGRRDMMFAAAAAAAGVCSVAGIGSDVRLPFPSSCDLYLLRSEEFFSPKE
uniref:Uncharacterized protein n=1 Tax=Salix viminalis TaxID=40686 RepID=A0A6N2LCA6_SALVM